jgi:hypothetical protein
MSSHAFSYLLMMPINVPQLNTTTTVDVLRNALSIGPHHQSTQLSHKHSIAAASHLMVGRGLCNRTLLLPSVTAPPPPKYLSFILLCATYLLESICLGV